MPFLIDDPTQKDRLGQKLVALVMGNRRRVMDLIEQHEAKPIVDRNTFKVFFDYRLLAQSHCWEMHLVTDGGTVVAIDEDDWTPLSRYLADLLQPEFVKAGCPVVEPAILQDLFNDGEYPLVGRLTA